MNINKQTWFNIISLAVGIMGLLFGLYTYYENKIDYKVWSGDWTNSTEYIVNGNDPSVLEVSANHHEIGKIQISFGDTKCSNDKSRMASVYISNIKGDKYLVFDAMAGELGLFSQSKRTLSPFVIRDGETKFFDQLEIKINTNGNLEIIGLDRFNKKFGLDVPNRVTLNNIPFDENPFNGKAMFFY